MPALPLVLTMGEPAGIAPEITAAAWRALAATGPAFALIGDAALVRDRAQALGRDIAVREVATIAAAAAAFGDALPVLPCPLGQPAPAPGHPDPGHAPAVIRSIDRAVELALGGEVAGIVTNPIQKETLYAAGFRHEGHTDYLAELAVRAGHHAEPVMMLSVGSLRSVPVTVHIPLKDVPERLTQAAIERQALVLAAALTQRFGIARPRLAVTGLNPHAGEGGTIGEEEVRIIRPAIRALEGAGLDVAGPLPADTAFQADTRDRFDAIVCMYHDQALIPIKTLGFHEGVNTTLGLPFIRTSPDHGTALALAGTGRANPQSLIAALRLAEQMAGASSA
ncbi:MAG: 4-hydroxythreonine-4-phosphate dehydrogenase PdxA [Aestuariivirgaceae bacterium]